MIRPMDQHHPATVQYELNRVIPPSEFNWQLATRLDDEITGLSPRFGAIRQGKQHDSFTQLSSHFFMAIVKLTQPKRRHPFH